ncbi:low molecular weight protein-tyrosine-phosphatase [Georgenia sp. Z1344]|uniref:low molecular weight protein-tyrosine-phosphatase n=1 Tax=Georgenia sp. Z1344 TaxID=3416706 RepID=UPI003CF35B80
MRLPVSRPVRVLVVCTGNICRSPMGERMLADELERAGVDADVTSGGTSDYEVGNPIDPRAASTLHRRGVPVEAHTARQVTAEDLGAVDLVLAMTEEHAVWLRRLAERSGVDPGVIMLWRAAEGPDAPGAGSARDVGSLDVPDPWWGDDSDFESTYELLAPGARMLAAALAAGRTELHP